MTPIITTAPAAYPVSLAELRTHLTIETQEFDARLAALIATATEMVEAKANRALVTRAYRAFMDQRNTPEGGYPDVIELPRAPLVAVQAVTTISDAGVESVFDSANYFLDTSGVVGRLCLYPGASWPATRLQNGLMIDWTAGFGSTPGAVPEMLRHAILVAAAWLYEQTGDGAGAELPAAVVNLIAPHKNWIIA